MSEELQNEVNTLKAENHALKTNNESLKTLLAQNNQGVEHLMNQLDAHKGELADARTISLQLRSHVIMLQKANEDLKQRLKSFEVN